METVGNHAFEKYAGEESAPHQATIVDIPASSTEAQTDIAVGQWDANFWNCFQHCVPNCCMATFCSCVSVAQIMARLGMLKYYQGLAIMVTLNLGYWVLTYLAIYTSHPQAYDQPSDFSSDKTSSGYSNVLRLVGLTCGFAVVFTVVYIRLQTRSRFKIPGNFCLDLVASCCCPWCTITQMATHVKSYKPGHCDFTFAVDTLPPYV